MKPQTEPFTEFAKLGRGVPKLVYFQNRKTAHVALGRLKCHAGVTFSRLRRHFTHALEKVAALGAALDDPKRWLKEVCE